jgi:dipicolinate synthase subunit B
MKIGYCFTGSFCTFARSFSALHRLVESGHDVVPIMSENAYNTDTRFQKAEEFSASVEALCGRKIIHTVVDAEPLGPHSPLDILAVAPCTGNTLAKVANGITDTAATMAIKAHLRADRPLVIALATNDALSRNLANIATMLSHKAVYFVPMLQDSPVGKPHSLVAELELIPEVIDAAMKKEQQRPIFLTRSTIS